MEAMGLSVVRAASLEEQKLFPVIMDLYKAAGAPMRSLYSLMLKEEVKCDLPTPANSPDAPVCEGWGG